MDSNSIILIVSLGVLLLLSAYFSATETAFSSLNRIRLKNKAEEGDKRAALTLSLAEDFDRLLSTILIGNNIVNITSASLSTVLFVKYFGDSGVTISTAAMTVLVLIFGEISPKSLAKEQPEGYAMFVAPSIRFLTWLLTPLNFLFQLWKKLLNKIIHTKREEAITEQELITIVDEAETQGGIGEYAGGLIRAAIEFNELEAGDILTPRVNLTGIAVNATTDEIAQQFENSGFSRLLVYQESLDQIVGILHEKDFFIALRKGTFDLQKAAYKADFVTEGMKVQDLLRLFQRSKNHMAIVVDDFGGTLGIITMEDILEELVGEIWDEHDEIIENIHPLSENSYLVSGRANLEKTFSYLDIDYECESVTVSGWIIDEMGSIPHAGESFTWRNLQITITKADNRRILEARIEMLPEAVD